MERSYMPETPCNTGCPRSSASGLAKLGGLVFRRITASQDGCGYRGECDERGSVPPGLGNYRGDIDYLNRKYGELPGSTSRPEGITYSAEHLRNVQDWRDVMPPQPEQTPPPQPPTPPKTQQ